MLELLLLGLEKKCLLINYLFAIFLYIIGLNRKIYFLV